MNLHHRPLFPIAAVYGAGIVLAAEMRLPPAISLCVGLGAVLAAAVLPIAKCSRIVAVLGAAVFLFGMLTTSAAWVIPADSVSRLAEDKLVYLTGVVVSDPEPRDNGGIRMVVRAESVKTYTGEYPVTGEVMATIYRPRWGAQDMRYVPFHGDRLRVHGRLRVPGPPANADSGSYSDYLARRGIYCTLSASTDEIVRIGSGAGGMRLAAAVLKQAIIERITRMLPGDRGSLLTGVLLGNYAALPLGVQAAFMRTGTMHLLAASGYNCGVIVLIFGWLLRRLTVPRAWMHVLLILLLWVFAVLVGAGPSIVRATVMVTAFLGAYLLWRSPDLLNIVLLSGLVILGANPLSLYDVGFQLSFSAVLAIILLMPFLNRCVTSQRDTGGLDKRKRGLLLQGAAWSGRSLLSAVLLSIAATIGAAPVTAYYFNYISLVSILANAAVALLVVALTALGIAALALHWVPLLGPALAVCSSWVAGGTLSVVVSMSGLAWASYSVRSPPPLVMLLYYAGLLAVLGCVDRRAKKSVGSRVGKESVH